LDGYINDTSHPYDSLFDILPAGRSGFADNQQRLLTERAEAHPEWESQFTPASQDEVGEAPSIRQLERESDLKQQEDLDEKLIKDLEAIDDTEARGSTESLNGFLKWSRGRRHVWTKGVDDSPEAIWEHINGDEKLKARYLKYQEDSK
jgi:hypothetical protein